MEILFGDKKIDQQKLLENAANNVNSYIESKPWSNKRKELFMKAYADIASNGIIGASSDTGQWMINTQSPVEYPSKKGKAQDMYKEAAYFFLKTMQDYSTPEEEKKKLPLYDNKTHQSGITTFLRNNLFGGSDFDSDAWNNFDPRDDKTKLRGVANRMKKLADVLDGYSNSLEENKYNFEGSAFKDYNDLKNRLSSAATSLRNGVLDDNVKDALYKVGINWKTYLSDGSDDPITVGDKQMTVAQYNELLRQNDETKAAEEAQKAALEAQKLKQQEKDNMSVLQILSGIVGTDARTRKEAYANHIADTYGVGNQGFQAVNTAVQQLLEKGLTGQLDSKDKRQLGNFLSYIRQNNPNYQNLGNGQRTNLSQEEWDDLIKHNNLPSYNINDYIRLPWQLGNRVHVYADNKGNVYYLKPGNQKRFANATQFDRQKMANYRNNFLLGTRAGKEANKQAYLQQPVTLDNLSAGDKAELAGVALDIASILDFEPWSAGALGVAAAGARHYARNVRPGHKTLGENIWQGVDYATGALGFLPLAGDALLTYKTAKNIGNVFRILSRTAAGYDLIQGTPGMLALYNKWQNGEPFTKDDLFKVGQFVRGLAATRSLNVTNRAQRKAIQERGFETEKPKFGTAGKWAQKAGIFQTKVKQGTQQAFVKVKVDGKPEEIAISKDSEKALAERLGKAGNNQEKIDKAVAETPEVKAFVEKAKKPVTEAKKPAEGEAKPAEGEAKPAEEVQTPKVEVEYTNSARNARYNSIIRVPARFRDNSSIIGYRTEDIPISRASTQEKFDNYLKSRGWTSKMWYGSNRTMRGMDRATNYPNGRATETGAKEAAEQAKQQEAKETAESKGTKKLISPPNSKGSGQENISKPNSVKEDKKLLALPYKNNQREYIGARPTEQSSNQEYRQLINNWIDSYGLNPKRGNRSIAGGFNETINLKEGTHNTTLHTNKGDKKISITKDSSGNYIVEIDGEKNIFDNLQNARQSLSRDLFKLSKNTRISELGEVLKEFKKLGWLKQGGQVNTNLRDTISNFLKN